MTNAILSVTDLAWGPAERAEPALPPDAPDFGARLAARLDDARAAAPEADRPAVEPVQGPDRAESLRERSRAEESDAVAPSADAGQAAPRSADPAANATAAAAAALAALAGAGATVEAIELPPAELPAPVPPPAAALPVQAPLTAINADAAPDEAGAEGDSTATTAETATDVRATDAITRTVDSFLLALAGAPPSQPPPTTAVARAATAREEGGQPAARPAAEQGAALVRPAATVSLTPAPALASALPTDGAQANDSDEAGTPASDASADAPAIVAADGIASDALERQGAVMEQLEAPASPRPVRVQEAEAMAEPAASAMPAAPLLATAVRAPVATGDAGTRPERQAEPAVARAPREEEPTAGTTETMTAAGFPGAVPGLESGTTREARPAVQAAATELAPRTAEPQAPVAPGGVERVTVRIGEGADRTRIQVTLHDGAVHARIIASDAATAERLAASAPELSRGLADRGFREARLQVGAAAGVIGVAAPATGGEGTAPRDDQGRDAHDGARRDDDRRDPRGDARQQRRPRRDEEAA